MGFRRRDAVLLRSCLLSVALLRASALGGDVPVDRCATAHGLSSDDSLHVFVLSEDSTLWQKRQEGDGWSNWQLIGAGNRYEYDEKTLADIEAFYQPWMCPEGTYSTNGQPFASPPSHSLKYLIHLGEVAKTSEDEGVHTFHVGSLFTFFVLMFLLMTWTYGIGAPAGLFVPSLAVGAAFGQLVGRGVMYAAEADHLSENIDLHTYAVVGAAAMLGGATRMTISITLLVMESLTSWRAGGGSLMGT